MRRDVSRDGWRIETARPRDLAAEAVAAWRDLAARALEPNPFMEPDYVLAAAQHLPEGRHVVVILAWQGGALRGVLPTVAPRLPWPRREARVWEVPLSASGAPLLDADAPQATLDAILGFLARSDPRLTGLSLPGLPARGAVAALLAEGARRARWTVRPGNAATLRLAGERATGAAVRDGVELFLALGAGRGEECLLQDPASATFVRAVTRLFAARDACAVELVREGGLLREATVSLGRGGSERPWLAAGRRGGLVPERVDAVLPLAPAQRGATAA
jgi:hypothetical protein